jgi:hypothetical protein
VNPTLPHGDRIVGIGMGMRPAEIRRLDKRLQILEKTRAHNPALPNDWIAHVARQSRGKHGAATNSQTHDWMVRLALQHLSTEQQELLHTASLRSDQGRPYSEAESAASQALESEVELIYQL